MFLISGQLLLKTGKMHQMLRKYFILVPITEEDIKSDDGDYPKMELFCNIKMFKTRNN